MSTRLEMHNQAQIFLYFEAKEKKRISVNFYWQATPKWPRVSSTFSSSLSAKANISKDEKFRQLERISGRTEKQWIWGNLWEKQRNRVVGEGEKGKS